MSATVDLTIKDRCWYATMEQWQTPGSNPPAAQVIVPGVKVQYLGHIVGGMVKVLHNNAEVVIHPGATEELG